MPQYHMVIPHYLGRYDNSKPESSDEETMPQENDSNSENHKVFKKVNSFSSNASYPDIPLLLPQDPVGPTPDNSVDISGTNKKSPPIPLPLGKKKPQGLPMKTFVAEMGSPELDKGVVFDVGPLSGSEVRNGEEEWWEQQERGDQVASEIELGQVGPRTTCHCQVISFTLKVSLNFKYRFVWLKTNEEP